MSLAEIKTAIERLSFEERAELAAWLHGWKDDDWDEQMKRDIAAGKFDTVLRESSLGRQSRTAPRHAVKSRTHPRFRDRFNKLPAGVWR